MVDGSVTGAAVVVVAGVDVVVAAVVAVVEGTEVVGGTVCGVLSNTTGSTVVGTALVVLEGAVDSVVAGASLVVGSSVDVVLGAVELDDESDTTELVVVSSTKGRSWGV